MGNCAGFVLIDREPNYGCKDSAKIGGFAELSEVLEKRWRPDQVNMMVPINGDIESAGINRFGSWE